MADRGDEILTSSRVMVYLNEDEIRGWARAMHITERNIDHAFPEPLICKSNLKY